MQLMPPRVHGCLTWTYGILPGGLIESQSWATLKWFLHVDANITALIFDCLLDFLTHTRGVWETFFTICDPR